MCELHVRFLSLVCPTGNGKAYHVNQYDYCQVDSNYYKCHIPNSFCQSIKRATAPDSVSSMSTLSGKARSVRTRYALLSGLKKKRPKISNRRTLWLSLTERSRFAFLTLRFIIISVNRCKFLGLPKMGSCNAGTSHYTLRLLSGSLWWR